MPTPPEGSLTRTAAPGSPTVNMPLWRDQAANRLFLLRFEDGVERCHGLPAVNAGFEVRFELLQLLEIDAVRPGLQKPVGVFQS